MGGRSGEKIASRGRAEKLRKNEDLGVPIQKQHGASAQEPGKFPSKER